MIKALLQLLAAKAYQHYTSRPAWRRDLLARRLAPALAGNAKSPGGLGGVLNA
jgi:hypothetical protein